jgi:multidrug transporter EmrE-like cation transporter
MILWLAGFICYNVAAIPNAIASKALPPHIISAISGWGITVIVLLSFVILKEKLYATDFIFSTTMVVAIWGLSLLDKPTAGVEINETAFYILLVLPWFLLSPLLVKRLGAKPRAILLAIYAGSAGGLVLVIMNIVIKSLGFDIFSYFNTVYPYLYVLCGVAQFVAMQMAIRLGSMILVGPLQNVLMIVYPAACSIFIFGASLSLLQLVMIAVIVGSSFMIMRKH